MSTRFLFVLSLVVAIFAAWFYNNQGELDTPINFAKSNIEYQATDILAIQTNDEGMAEYSLIADDLTHYTNENIDKLKTMTLSWRPNTQKSITINADEAVIRHDDAIVTMTNNVVFVSENVASLSTTNTSNAANRPPMRLVADTLVGDLNNDLIYSNQPVLVTQGDNTFESASFTADMNSGEYEFNQVAVTFIPPPRKDVPLF